MCLGGKEPLKSRQRMTACLPISSRLVLQGSFLDLKHGAVIMLHSSVGARLHKDTC